PPLVCGPGDSIAGRCETVRPSTGVQRRAGGPGQGDGLHTASRQRPAAVAVVVPGAGAPRRRRRDRRVTFTGDRAPVAVRGRDQTLAVPVVDLHHRSRLRRQGATGARPLRPDLEGKTFGRRRLRRLRRRKDLHPGPLPLPPHPARRHVTPDPGQPRLPPTRRPPLAYTLAAAT